MYVQDFDSKCAICKLLEKGEDVIHEEDVMVAVLNGRWSPHLFRTAVVPKRHIGDKGTYGLQCLDMEEKADYSLLRRIATDAIIHAAKSTGNKLKTREGQPLIDCLVRPSYHPSADLIPHYEGPAKLGEYVFPRYVGAEIEAGSSGVTHASVIVASFPKSEAEKLTMPKDLRRKTVSVLKESTDVVLKSLTL